MDHSLLMLREDMMLVISSLSIGLDRYGIFALIKYSGNGNNKYSTLQYQQLRQNN